MNFISIREYFYKMANRCLIMVILPLVAFIYVYYQILSGKRLPITKEEGSMVWMMYGLPALALLNVIVFHRMSLARMKKYRVLPGLGNKLDRFYEVTMLRMRSVAISSLLLAIGLIFTGSEWFAISFVMVLLWVPMQWPTARRVCKELRLRGDEREMVYHKKDKF